MMLYKFMKPSFMGMNENLSNLYGFNASFKKYLYSFWYLMDPDYTLQRGFTQFS